MGWVCFDGTALKDGCGYICRYYDPNQGGCPGDYVDYDGTGLKRIISFTPVGVSCDGYVVYYDGTGLSRRLQTYPIPCG